MTDVYIIQPSEMGEDFNFNTSTAKWEIAKKIVSDQPENAIENYSETGAYLSKSDLKKYRIIQDNSDRKINLYEYSAALDFSESTALLIDSIDMVSFDLEVDDIEISNGVLTFTDKDTNQTLVFDTDSPIYQILSVNTNAVSVTGDGKVTPLSIDLTVDSSSDNLVKITTSGLMVDENDILDLLNRTGGIDFSFTNDSQNGYLKLTINGVDQTVATSRLLNTNGDLIGYILV